MEQWRAVPEGATESLGSFERQKVHALREELGLQESPRIQESLLDIKKIMSKARLMDIGVSRDYVVRNIPAVWDRLHRLIVEIPQQPPEVYRAVCDVVRTMAIVHDVQSEVVGREWARIIAVQLLWSRVGRGDNSTQDVPTHWFCTMEFIGKGEACYA